MSKTAGAKTASHDLSQQQPPLVGSRWQLCLSAALLSAWIAFLAWTAYGN